MIHAASSPCGPYKHVATPVKPWQLLLSKLLRTQLPSLQPRHRPAELCVAWHKCISHGPACSRRLLDAFTAVQGAPYGTRSQTMLVIKLNGEAEWHEHWRVPGTETWETHVQKLDLAPGQRFHKDEL